MSDVRQWLAEHGLSQLTETFEREQIDLPAARTLTDVEIRQLGLPLGLRSRLRAALEALQSEAPMAAETVHTYSTARAAERRQLTILFCDLVDSTAWSQRLDPEWLRELMQSYQHSSRQVIERYEGHVAQYLGDGLMVYFGWPRAHEDDAERAVRAALELVSAVGAMRAPQANAGEGLRVRIGIATGPVVVGETGGGDASVPKLAVGETPNLAARLQGLAAPGQIILGASTRRLLGGVFDLTDLGSHTLKGIVEPVAAFAVQGLNAQAGRFAATRAGADLTPLIGREDELALIGRRWQRTCTGQGHAVLLSAEAGIGKSRIVQAVRAHLGGTHQERAYHCSPFHLNAALHPFVEGFKREAGFEREDSPDALLDKMEHTLSEAGLDLSSAAPLMAALLGLPPTRYGEPRLTPQKQKEKTLACLVDYLCGWAARAPLLLMFEDAHWADPTSRELLDLLMARIEQVPMLLLLTCRPEFAPPWVGHSQVSLLSLSRLSKRESEALIARVARGRRMPEAVVSHIVTRTDGVPLFVEEFTQSVLESGVLRATEEGYALSGPLSALPVPATLQDSLMARLDRLAKGKEIAQVGACIGREFGHDLLAAVLQRPEIEWRAGLKELLSAGLLHAQGVAPRAQYVFKHALVCDAAYASLLHARRERLHERIAQVLEQVFPELAASDPQVLAQHLSKAAKHREALPYWLQSGQNAYQRFALAEAMHCYQAALQCLDHWPAELGTRVERMRVLGLLCNVRLVGEGLGAPGQLEAFQQLQSLSDDLKGAHGVSFARLILWWYHAMCADYRACETVIDQIAAFAEDDPVLELSRRVWEINSRLCTVVFYGRLVQTWGLSRELLSIVSNHTRPSSIPDHDWRHNASLVYDYGSWCLLLQGYPERARRERQRGMDDMQGEESPFTRVSYLTHELISLPWARNPKSAEPLAREVIAQAEEHGFKFRVAEGQMVLGWALTELGQIEHGLQTLRAGYELFKSIGFRIATSIWLSLFVYAYQRAGRPQEASETLQRALAFCHETGEAIVLAELRRLQGELMLAQADADRLAAEREFMAAMEIARGQGAKLFELRAACSLARLLQAQARNGEARAALQPVYDCFTEGFDLCDLQEAKVILAELIG